MVGLRTKGLGLRRSMLEPATNTTKGYKGLIAYKKALENTVVLFRYYKARKLLWVERFLIEQLLRSATSIGANIAEGYGRQSKKDYRRFLGIARGSALEVEYWICFLIEIRPQDKEVLAEIQVVNTEIIKILTVLRKNLNS